MTIKIHILSGREMKFPYPNAVRFNKGFVLKVDGGEPILPGPSVKVANFNAGEREVGGVSR